MNLIEEKLHERIIAKKIELDKYRPLSEKIVKKLHRKMEIEYTYHSNALEGNTLTHRETQLVIREGITIGGKSLRDHLEAKNHPKAIEYIETLIDHPLCEEDILRVHEIIFSGILENAGNYRKSQVFVEGADFVPSPAFEVPVLMKELIKWLNSNPQELRPIEIAGAFHYKFVSIHPFDDGNGRIARMLMNLLLMKYDYPLTIIKTYNRRRYYDTLKKADNGNLKPLVNFIARCVEESLDLYLVSIKPDSERGHLLKLAKAAQDVPYTQEYLSLLARRGKIAAVKIGKDWHVSLEALETYTRSVKSRRKKAIGGK